MCTASWINRPGGYELFFNRDERRTRLPARPPAPLDAAGTAFLAPLDGDALGTWIGVNRHGLSLALLNGFPARSGAPPAAAGDDDDWTSRGHLIPRLISARSAADALDALCRLPLDRFRPLLLLALDASGSHAVGDWSGDGLETRTGRQAPGPPLISSSFCTEAVRASRIAVWRSTVGDAPHPDADAHARFHRSHEPQRGPHSVCMHRPDARTVSFTRIDVDERTVSLEYTPDAPCRGRPEPPLRLERGTPPGLRVGVDSEA